MAGLFHVLFIVLLINSALAVPVNHTEAISEVSTENVEVEATTGSLPNRPNLSNSDKDLYVIKSVVYEIGILTEPGNDTDFDNTTHEQVELTFFDPAENETSIDLSNIPVPIQTNISGVSITGIVSANFGDIHLLKNGTPTIDGSHFPLWPGKEVKVTQNLVTSDQEKSSSILSSLPDILGLEELQVGHGNDTETSDKSS